jgi:hypothetical protein
MNPPRRGGGWAKQTHASLNGTEKEREAQAQRRPDGSGLDRLSEVRGPDPAGSES